MVILRKLFTRNPVSKVIQRFCSSFNKEYNTTPDGNLNIALPFNAVIRPLDVVDHPESNKVIIKCPQIVNCSVVRDVCNISTSVKEYNADVTCEIYAPIKTSINASCHGNITIKDFLGEAVRLFSEHGDITLGSFKNDYVIATTNRGNISTEGSINAAKVGFRAFKNGNVYTNKLKCLGLHIETDDGVIETKSSYCDESYFVTKCGEMNLHNVHKNSKIVFHNKGKLNMIGFNGFLDLKMNQGVANIQISELTGKSSINIKEKGQLMLKLSDSVLDGTTVDIHSNCCVVEDDIPHEENEVENFVQIKAKDLERTRLFVRAEDSVVTVKSGSWAEMIEKRFLENVSNN